MDVAVLSIRYKLIIAVVALYLLMAAGILGSHYFMRQLEQKIGYLEDISKLEESALEIRRFEKNFFLYGDRESLRTALYHLSRVDDVLEKNFAKIEALSSKEATEKFKENLRDYKQAILKCSDLAADSKCPPSSETLASNEANIRRLGASISDFAEEVIRAKRQSIKETIGATARLQLVPFVLAGIGLIAVGSILFTKVMKPLKLLEESTVDIAKGRFKPIENLPQEREIRDIFDSFNRMASQLKIREEQLVQSRKLASLGTMLAGVAHEINNPLSNISSSCEILLEEIDLSDKEFQISMLRKVVEQVDKARTIVLNLLEFSRNKEFSKQTVNLKQIIQSCLRLLHGQIPSSVQIVTHIPEYVTIFADKQRVQQAFLNLISNAVQAIPDQGEVTISAEASKDGMVTLVIRDTGSGIKEEDIQRIFDPFFTTKDVGQGTGLGLFITHDIILRHKGAIKVESAVDVGTSFIIKLPAEENAA